MPENIGGVSLIERDIADCRLSGFSVVIGPPTVWAARCRCAHPGWPVALIKDHDKHTRLLELRACADLRC
mgnify:FL=1